MRIVDFYNVAPDEIKPGDVMMCVVKAMVVRQTSDGKPIVRFYRCPFNGEIPDGDPIPPGPLDRSVFPVLKWAGGYIEY